MHPVIVTDLTKSFRVRVRASGENSLLHRLRPGRHEKRTVVQEVSFTAERGELLGLLGPNGAGKSTTIKMMAGILQPSAGTVLINGFVPSEQRIACAATIGAVFGQRTQLWWDLPALDSFTILRDIYGVPDRSFQLRLGEFDELLGLSSFWHRPVRTLSLGQRVRCDLAAALIHDPSVIFLDEPTIGMDVVVKDLVRVFLRYIVEELRRTVLLTTHDMSDVEQLCERVLMIDRGRISFDGNLSLLRSSVKCPWGMTVMFSDDDDHASLGGGTLVERHGRKHTFRFSPDRDPQQVMREITAHHRVESVSLEEAGLEELMREIYRGNSDIALPAARGAGERPGE
ncbi:ATP-binding cassette domain-containing protein [Streptomyces sp. NPDC088719]|uniref:ABC transporter ATP-binding protein n=1 Tax=Streptomyces sp. NPDC088719 TaxID=3365872 RepID=UPI003823A586